VAQSPVYKVIYYTSQRKTLALVDIWYHNFFYYTNGILWSWSLLFRQAFKYIRNSGIAGISTPVSVCCTVGGKHAQLEVFYHVLRIVRYIYDLCHIVIVWPSVTDRLEYSRSVLHRDCFTLSPCVTDRELYSRSVAHRDIGHVCKISPSDRLDTLDRGS
jgi:hypothetical protein